jgi:hypothetical protein
MEKQKTTVYLDAGVLTAAKAVALASRRTDSAVIEDALRLYIQSGRGETARDELSALLTRVAARGGLDEDAAMAQAVEEVHAVRRSRRTAASGA